jgi:deoxyribodipyrimidine photo-lyase
MTNSPTIVLIRRDLRLADNPALHEAVARGGPVILVYIRETDDPDAGALGAAQHWWLHHSLTLHMKACESRGSRIVLRSGRQNDVVAALVAETGAGAVYWNRRYHRQGRDTDAALKVWLKDRGVEAKSFAANLLHEPSKLLTGTGGPYRVYTPFWKAFSAREHFGEPLPPPARITGPDALPESETLESWKLLPARPNWAAGFEQAWIPGEQGGKAALLFFLEDAVKGYRIQRDFPGGEHTSRLSPHLALGEISPLQIWHAVVEAENGNPTEDTIHFRKELAWREFSWHLLFHYPDLADSEFNPRFADFGWNFDERAFRAWTRGTTGYPIVDAGMRELWQTGWMHNRVRMIAASFLIKDLMIDWRHGERWFRDTLVDADPASNAASWQWVAGSGADAAPYFRIFNPVLQGEKFDPKGDYIRRYVPEISRLSNDVLHRPFEAQPAALQKAEVRLGFTYPRPMVDHAAARDRALRAYEAVKGSD